MGEYGSGLSMGTCAEYDKERVRHALAGELICGETEEDGFMYAPASKAECDEYILGVVDEWYFQAKKLADAARATERIMQRHGFDMMQYFQEYVNEMAIASHECNDYLYEYDKEDLEGDIAEIERLF